MKTFKGLIIADPIDIPTLLREHPTPATDGAQLLFTGVVRNRNHGRTVTAVSYDAFAPLAEKVFQDIGAEAGTRWGPLSVTIVHRTGKLLVGEISVAVLVTAPHRGEAYLASRYAVDELKTRAPIWKQEHYVDGQTEWLPGHALCQHGEHHSPERRS